MSDANAQVATETLHAMTAALTHRGPDGEGYLVRGNIGFGHRRLSIIDLEGGDQPIFNEDGRIGIVFNGEIYNYVELMDDLRSRGHQFKTASDTEVIVHLYEEFGSACVQQLRGMFTFAIWDGRSGEVFLARDRIGIKPLFYAATSDRLLFGSELKSIVSDPAFSRTVDESTLAEYLAYGYIPGDRCIFQGVAKLPPGSTLTWDAGSVEVQSYWDVTALNGDPLVPSDCVTHLQSELDDTLRIHLRADVPVGVLLSGGVDSATMVALASRHTNIPIKTFSVGFQEQSHNELEVARLTAQRYQTDHHEMIVEDRDISVLESIAWHLDEPFADPSVLPTYYVCREAAKHVKVCLTGDGADEVFAGYTRYRMAMRYDALDRIPLPLRSAVFGTVGALMPQVMWGKGFLTRLGSSGARRYLNIVGVFSHTDCSSLLRQASPSTNRELTRILDPYFLRNGCDTLATLQHADMKTYLPDDILVKADRMSMQNSLEVRPPFLDHKVIELASRFPSSVKVDNGVSKAVLKRAVADRIPAQVIQRRKSGFGLPIKDWFRGGLESYARDMLLAPSARSTTFFDRRAIDRIVTGHQAGMRDLSRRIWSLLIFEQWCRAYRV